MTLYEVLTAADAMPLLMIGPRLMITCSGSSVRSSLQPRGSRARDRLPRRGCLLVEETAARNRVGTGYSRPSGWPRAAAWRPLPLKFCIRSYQPPDRSCFIFDRNDALA